MGAEDAGHEMVMEAREAQRTPQVPMIRSAFHQRSLNLGSAPSRPKVTLQHAELAEKKSTGATDAKKKGTGLKVLILTGRQSNENLAGFQLSGFKAALTKEADIHILCGDHVWSYTDGRDMHDVDAMTLSLAKGKDFTSWFDFDTDCKKPRVDMWKLFDKDVKVDYKTNEVEGAVDKLLNYVQANGPFDMVCGMFEGAIVIHLAVARLLQQGKEAPWKVSAFLGGLPIRDDKYLEAFAKKKSKLHTIHVFGKLDEYTHYARTAAGRMAPEDYYEKPTVMYHEQPHQMPSAKPRSDEIYNRIVDEAKYWNGRSTVAPARMTIPKKPVADRVLDWETVTPRKLRILCFAGGHSCTDVIKFQTANLRQQFGKDNAEYVFVEGTEDWEWYEGEPTVSDMEKTIARGKQLKNYYMDKCHEEGLGYKNDDSKRLNREKQFDPKVWVEYKELPERLEYWARYIIEEGPFDAVIAFSQGGIFLHHLIGHFRTMVEPEVPDCHDFTQRWKLRRFNKDIMPWRISCFFNTMHVRDKRYMHYFGELNEERKKLDHPTVMIYGKADEFYEYSRGIESEKYGKYDENKTQEDYYENPMVLTHEENHQFPTAQPRARQIYERVIGEIWKHCGGKP